MSSKNVLIIVHDFPPMGGGGVMRVVKFAKYLPEFGWRPLILTLEARYFAARLLDESLGRELPPDLPIVRTPSLKPEASTRAQVIAESNAATGVGRTLHPSVLMRKAKHWLEERVMLPKDEGYLWLPYARPALRRLLREQPIDAVLTSSPPHNVHWLGATAKRWGRIPWIVDFRDGWTDDMLFQARSGLRNSIERSQERHLLTKADRILCATEHCCADFARRYGPAIERKSTVLFNGFDPADFQEGPSESVAESQPPASGSVSPVLRIVHAGSAGGDRRPVRPFLKALEILHRENPAAPIAVDFYGTISNDVAIAAATPGVTHHGFVPHAEAVRAMRAADVLLLVQGRDAVDAVAGKVFEYAAAARPILTLTLPGALMRFIEANRWGRVTNLEDADAIAEALRDLVARKQSGALDALRPTPESVRLYDRRETTRRLAALLDDVTCPGAS